MMQRREKTTSAARPGREGWARQHQDLNFGIGEGGSKFFVKGLGGGLTEAFERNSREAKGLDQEGGEVPVHGGGGYPLYAGRHHGRGCRPAGRDQSRKPGCGLAPPPHQSVGGLFGQQSFGVSWDGGEVEAALQEGDVQLLMGQTLQVALPQEITNSKMKIRCCRIRKGWALGQVPSMDTARDSSMTAHWQRVRSGRLPTDGGPTQYYQSRGPRWWQGWRRTGRSP